MTKLKNLVLTTDDYKFKSIPIEKAIRLYCSSISRYETLSELCGYHNISIRTANRIIKYFDIKVLMIIQNSLEAMKHEIKADTINTNGICVNFESMFSVRFIKYVRDVIGAYNVHETNTAAYIVKYFLENNFKTWDKFSGDKRYPVPPPKHFKRDPNYDGSLAKQAYYNCRHLWKGNYGKLRIDLVNHLYKMVTTQLELKETKK